MEDKRSASVPDRPPVSSRVLLAKQQRGFCMERDCHSAALPHEFLCKEHWLSLPIQIQREVVRAQNSRDVGRVRKAWHAAVTEVNRG